MSTHDSDLLKRIARFFDIDAVNELLPLSGGVANYNYLLQTAREEEYVIKILSNQKLESLENDRAIQQQLKQSGIPTIFYEKNMSGDYIYNDKNVVAVLSKRVAGVKYLPQHNNVDNVFCFSLGKILAQFHEIVTFIPYNNEGWLNPLTSSRYITSEKQPDFLAQSRELIESGKILYGQDLPAGIIHGDLHKNNVLVVSQENLEITAVFDFEVTEHNVLLCDIARTIIVCSAKDGNLLAPALVQSVIDGYQSIRELTQPEKDNLENALQYVAGATSFWLYEKGFADYAQKYVNRVINFDIGILNL